MPSPKLIPRLICHKDGSPWAKGHLKAGRMHGYWEWYRKDGSLMRSGHFEQDRQCGEWTTYAADGRIVKVTQITPKPATPRRTT